MKYSLAILGLVSAAVASPLYARQSKVCSFTITASGGASGIVGQLDDGQNRVGGGHPTGTYTLYSDGRISDAKGRGCILTPPTTQYQCDVGATGTAGFSISSSNQILYSGGSTFYACPVNDNGEYNIYSQTLPDQPKCVAITLTANGSCAPPVVPPPITPPPPPPVSPGCGTALKAGAFEFPHLIVPVSSANPNTAAGTSYFGTISSTVSTIFNFDIPASDAGKTCSLVFDFPLQSQLQTSSFTFSGDGQTQFDKLSSVATSGTTYNNRPSVAQSYGHFGLAPGNSYVVATFPCPAGTAVAYQLSNCGSTNLYYFQDYNPSPIGLYITVC